MGRPFYVSRDESGENKIQRSNPWLGVVSREFNCGNVRFYPVCYRKAWLLIGLAKRPEHGFSPVLFTLKCMWFPFPSRSMFWEDKGCVAATWKHQSIRNSTERNRMSWFKWMASYFCKFSYMIWIKYFIYPFG